jgi:hypothetical protein
MTIKYSKVLAIAGVAMMTSMMVPSSQAADPVVPVATTAVSTTGSITVIQKVVNDNNGTKIASDFTISIKHWGTPIVGSPLMAADGDGKTFVLQPGTYVVSQDIYDGYYGSWSGVGITNGFIDLEAGQAITIIRTLNDAGQAVSTPAVTDVPATEDGGVLPNTATPMYNYLIVGSLITAAGALGLRKFALTN